MPTIEPTMNDALAAHLRTTRCSWANVGVITSENSGRIIGSTERPDIIVAEPNTAPIVIETEVLPAATVEIEARSRLGRQLTSGRHIYAAIAVRMPQSFRLLDGLALADAISGCEDYDYALFTGEGTDTAHRWPPSGWLKGSAADLSLLTQGAAIPPHIINQAVDTLEAGVRSASVMLGELLLEHPGSLQRIAEHLCQQEGEQTRRMASTIIANALVFHESLAGGAGSLQQVKTIEELQGSGELNQAGLLREWRSILEVNYWPIFDIARRILEAMPAASAAPVAQGLASTAAQLHAIGLSRSHDLTGAVFQRLISDREFLAAYYTTPAAAALLVGLCMHQSVTPHGHSWSDTAEVCNLRIADFSCGTGTLLSTAYGRLGQLHELHGGDSAAIHPDMMAEAVTGCDVLPAAAHLTASMLASAHPSVTYHGSKILTVPFGAQPSGDYALGSIDLLDPQRHMDILTITARAAGGTGEHQSDTWLDIPHLGYHLVLMNPPFVRSTGQEADRVGVPRPMFAAFGNTEEDQAAMARAARRLTRGTCHHGNAGEASIFLEIGHRKLAEGGMLGLVMPLSLMMGDSWSDSRTLIAGGYAELSVASITGTNGDVAFSADTGMGECLIIARKRVGDELPATRATFILLDRRPGSPLEGFALAKEVNRLKAEGGVRRLEDGPVGGTPIRFGGHLVGQMIDAPLIDRGAGWQLARIRDLTLAQTAATLERGQIRLPQLPASESHPIAICLAREIGEIGPYHMDVDSMASGAVRGPFETFDCDDSSSATYPVLWAHDADRERTMIFAAEREGRVRQPTAKTDASTIERKVEEVWASASWLHVNQNFRFNSQSTAMQITPVRTIGGRAWMTLKLESELHEKVVALWGNSVFGLLLHWWQANKQQPGRGNMGKRVLAHLPLFDVRTLSHQELAGAAEKFDALATLPLRPFNEIADDENRRQIDEAVCTHLLGWPLSEARLHALQLLRNKLSAEPTISG